MSATDQKWKQTGLNVPPSIVKKYKRKRAEITPEDVAQDLKFFEEVIFNEQMNPEEDIIDGETKINRRNEGRFEMLKYTLSHYQEQPNLIQRQVNDLLNRILFHVKLHENNPKIVTFAFKFFHLFSKLKGAKRTLKYLPHQVDDLHWALAALEKSMAVDRFDTWEQNYSLLLCLSVTTSIPFNLSRFDPNPNPQKMIMVEKLIEIGKYFIFKDSSACGLAASLMLGKLFSRSDVQELYLNNFIAETIAATNNYLFERKMNLANQISGYVRVLCIVLKSSKRDEFLAMQSKFDHLEKLAEFARNVISIETYDMDQQVRHLCIKLAQRLALLYLPQRPITWRYERGKRSLAMTLGDEKMAESGESTMEQASNELTIEEQLDIDDTVPDIVEDVVDILLIALKDRELKIRWSAAKGLGRIAARLPAEYAADILPAIFNEKQIIEDADLDLIKANVYHGVAISIAELARRGLISVAELEQVIDFTANLVLTYDEVSVGVSSADGSSGNSTHSVSSQTVRDAGCYVCWSIARAYKASDITQYQTILANGLLTISTTDKEVNCRRAAAAAFQEYVGRQGTFPSGIDIITKIDFEAVAQSRRSFTEFAPWVVSLNPEVYQPGFIDHLLEFKIGHRDIETRKLACESLSLLWNYDRIDQTRRIQILDNLIKGSLAEKTYLYDYTAQHGHILSLGWLLKQNVVCYGLETEQADVFLQKILAIPEKNSKSSRWKGNVGTHIQSAAFVMIANFLKNYKTDNLESLKLIQNLAFESILHLNRVAEKLVEELIDSVLELYASLAENIKNSEQILPSVEDIFTETKKFKYERTNGTLLLMLPAIVKNNSQQAKVAVDLLNHVLTDTQNKGLDKEWTLFRRDALIALDKIVFGQENLEFLPIFITCLQESLNDYTISSDKTMFNKGDIGIYLRKQALILIAQRKIDNSELFPQIVKELGSKSVKVREPAVECMRALNFHTRNLAEFQQNQDSAGNFVSKELENAENFQLVQKLHALPDFKDENQCMDSLSKFYCQIGFLKPGLESLLICSGDITQSLMKTASKSIENMEINNEIHGPVILEILDENMEFDRVIVPTLNALEKIFTNSKLIDYEPLVTKFVKQICLNKNKRISRLLPAINCLDAILINLEEENLELIKMVLKKFSFLLIHSLPRIRNYTSEKLKESLLILEDLLEEHFENFEMEKMEEILKETDWLAIGQADHIKQQRKVIVDMLEM